jgi:transcriptional regulator GlxA family with amidase domain
MRLPAARALEAHALAQSGLGLVLEELVRAVEQRLPAAESQAALVRLVRAIDVALQSKQAAPARPRREEVECARQILHQRFDRPVSLTDLTRETGMSKFQLLRMFRREMGTTPHAYQIHVRISRARQLLDKGLAAAEVAMQCGFADQAHFSRCFKRIVGYSPRAFARIADGAPER